MAEPTAADRERAAELYDDFDMQWRHVDHIFELPDVVTDDLICRIAAALAEARQQQAWQKIETAPKEDFKDVLLFDGRYATAICIGHWSNQFGCWEDNGGFEQMPTHWMALPSPPSLAPTEQPK